MNHWISTQYCLSTITILFLSMKTLAFSHNLSLSLSLSPHTNYMCVYSYNSYTHTHTHTHTHIYIYIYIYTFFFFFFFFIHTSEIIALSTPMLVCSHFLSGHKLAVFTLLEASTVFCSFFAACFFLSKYLATHCCMK